MPRLERYAVTGVPRSRPPTSITADTQHSIAEKQAALNMMALARSAEVDASQTLIDALMVRSLLFVTSCDRTLFFLVSFCFDRARVIMGGGHLLFCLVGARQVLGLKELILAICYVFATRPRILHRAQDAKSGRTFAILPSSYDFALSSCTYRYSESHPSLKVLRILSFCRLSK